MVGFTGEGDQDNPFYHIGRVYPKLDELYGLLSGVLFALPLSITGLYMGIVADRYSRKWLIIIACIAWSAMQCAVGMS